MRLVWPQGKHFAFSVFDDTDWSTVENTRPVYDLLRDCGFRTTKSCWVRQPIAGETGKCPGMTTDDPEYLMWLLQLQQEGFEIGLHNVSYASSTRQQTILGFEKFQQIFGHPPYSLACHAGVRESVYGGDYRIGGIRRPVYNCLTLFRNAQVFDGHVKGTPGFWGDLCKQKVKYVRNFTFRELNTLRACPLMPYHDPIRPYVNYWFASTDGHDTRYFINAIREEAQDFLEETGGACIMYTHFARGFYRDGQLNARFVDLIRRLSKKDGWFVPVAQLLDYIGHEQGYHILTEEERRRLEWKWLWDKIHVGRS